MAGQSSDFEWKPRLSERALLGNVQFDVAKAKELIKASPRAVEMKSPSVFKPAYYLLDIKVDWEKAKAADLRVPVIAGTHEGKAIIIDGWQRYAMAIRTNQAEIPVVTLTEEELKQVRRG